MLLTQNIATSVSAAAYEANQDLASLYSDDDDIEGGKSIKFARVGSGASGSIGGMVRTKKHIGDPVEYEKQRERQRIIFAGGLVILMALAFYAFYLFNRASGRAPPSGVYPDSTYLFFSPKPSAVPIPLNVKEEPPKGKDNGGEQNQSLVQHNENQTELAHVSEHEHEHEHEHEVDADMAAGNSDESESTSEENTFSNDVFLELETNVAQSARQEEETLAVWHLSDLHIDPFYSPLDEHIQRGKKKICRPPTGEKARDSNTGEVIGRVVDQRDRLCAELERSGWQWRPSESPINLQNPWPLGRPKCDPPISTLRAALDFIKMKHASTHPHNPPVIVVTGDVVGHKIKCPYVVSRVREGVMREIREQLPEATVLFVAGNNDYNVKDAPTAHHHMLLLHDVGGYITTPATTDEESEVVYRSSGSYVADVELPSPTPAERVLRFIMFNSVVFSAENVNGIDGSDGDTVDYIYGDVRESQFVFLEKELARAREENVKVVLVTHTPPGAKAGMISQDEERLLDLLAPYVAEGRVLVLLAGDLSRNEIRSIDLSTTSCSSEKATDYSFEHDASQSEAPDEQDASYDANASHLTVLISGGLSSRKGGAPSVRRLEFGLAAHPQTGMPSLALLDWTDYAVEQLYTFDGAVRWDPVFNFRAIVRSFSAVAHPQVVHNLVLQLFRIPPVDVIFEIAHAYGLYASGGIAALDTLEFDQDKWHALGEWLLIRLQQEIVAAAWTPYSGSHLALSSREIYTSKILARLLQLGNDLNATHDAAATRDVVIEILKTVMSSQTIDFGAMPANSKGEVAVESARQVVNRYLQYRYPERLRCASLARTHHCHKECKEISKSHKILRDALKRGFEDLSSLLHQQSELFASINHEEL